MRSVASRVVAYVRSVGSNPTLSFREYKVDSSARLKVLGSEGSLVAGSIPAVPVLKTSTKKINNKGPSDHVC